jgi:chromosomal replication initiator protein
LGLSSVGGPHFVSGKSSLPRYNPASTEARGPFHRKPVKFGKDRGVKASRFHFLSGVISFRQTMGTVSDRTWSEILASLRAQHPELMRPWFTRLEPLDLHHGVIRVRTDDYSHYQYLCQQCQPAITEAAQAITGRLVTVNFLAPPTRAETELPLSFESETETLRLNCDYTFENFVTGPSNQLAHAACVAVGENPGRVYNPLFIHGSVGLGKTHLLQAACHQIRAGRPDAKILYISCETFTNHFIEAIERGALHQFRYRYRHVDMLVIDDIQFLAERERTREEFFHTFNTLFQSERQIILSADESPRGIPSLEDRLVSRFSWGLVARIDPPCLETRMAIVRKKAKLRCVDLPEDVLHLVAARAGSNTRELEGALISILALSQQYGGRLDLEVARKAFTEEAATPAKKIGIPDILQVVMDRFNIRLADLQGKRRHRSLASARQICMYLSRQLTTLSLGEIGGYFGGRDHTTVLHAIRTVEAQRELNTDLDLTLQQMIDHLRK